MTPTPGYIVLPASNRLALPLVILLRCRTGRVRKAIAGFSQLVMTGLPAVAGGEGGRKVRTLAMAVAGNTRPARAEDQRNRKDVQGVTGDLGKVSGWRRNPRAAVVKTGKLYGVQGQTETIRTIVP